MKFSGGGERRLANVATLPALSCERLPKYAKAGGEQRRMARRVRLGVPQRSGGELELSHTRVPAVPESGPASRQDFGALPEALWRPCFLSKTRDHQS
eukprot:scaffold88123_cov67-Phaeocystis_antarctica.AAC.7